jgi:hypothetical protein
MWSLLLLGSIAPAVAADTFPEALALYARGVNEAAVNAQAQAAFERLRASDPANPLYLAYLGSTWMIEAREAWMPWNKIAYADKGLALLDKSLALLEPAHEREVVEGMSVGVRVRSVAGIAYAGLPGMFNRFDQGRRLLRELTASSALATIEGPRRAYIYYFAGNAARRDRDLGDARAQYHAAIATAPESDYAQRARKALAEIAKEAP